MAVQPEIEMDTIDPLMASDELKAKCENWQPKPISHQPVIPQKPLALNDLGGQHDSLHDLNSPLDDALIELQYHKPEVRDFWQLTWFGNQVDEGKVVQKSLPKQTDIDKILKQIN